MQKNPPADPAPFKPRFAGIALLIAAIVLLGLWGVKLYTASDLDRDLQGWREKLNLIAESRDDAVSRFVSGRFADLQTLADNPSVQLYMGELGHNMGDMSAGAEPAEKSYLRNVLIFTAERAGFGGAASSESAALGADVTPENKNALAIIDTHNKVIVSTPWQDDAKNSALALAARVQAGKQDLIDLHKDKSGAVLMGFVVPVFAIEQPHNADSQIGKIIGIKVADSAFYGVLKHPGVTEKTLEVILLRKQDGKTDYLSPLQDGTGALSREGDNAKPSAESALIGDVGDFVSDKKDYRGKAVLATSRAVPGTPWILVAKIDRQEALADGNQRRASMVTLFFCAIAIVALLMMAMWWYAHSRRSAMLSRYFKELVREREQMLEVQRQLVQALIKLVDRRDPFAANHSQLVSRLSAEIAAGMGLSENVIDTVRMAANLMNVGKIFVPAELLTKTGVLTAEEKNIIRDSAASAVELVRGIYFGGPVAETLTQWQERWDGTGPLGIKGEGILISARIIAVANAFIGMTSPRSWRTALSAGDATKFLLNESGTLFDRRVADALVQYIENADDKSWMKAA